MSFIPTTIQSKWDGHSGLKSARYQCDAREVRLACGFFCLHDYRPDSLIVDVITLGELMADCPFCRHSMRLVSNAGLEVDVCDKCHGVWLDPSEFKFIDDLKSDLSKTESSVELWNFKCPSCSNRSCQRIDTDQGAVYGCGGCFGVYVPRSLVEVDKPATTSAANESEKQWFRDIFGPLGYIIEGLASLK